MKIHKVYHTVFVACKRTEANSYLDVFIQSFTGFCSFCLWRIRQGVLQKRREMSVVKGSEGAASRKIKSTMLRYFFFIFHMLPLLKFYPALLQPTCIKMIMMKFTDSPTYLPFFQEQLQKSLDFQKEGLQKTSLPQGVRDRSHR